MHILIAHISDIHIRVSTDPVLARPKAVAQAIVSLLDGQTKLCILAVSGDVVYSGARAEYALAAPFLRAVLDTITEAAPTLMLKCILIPGNHDCDFSATSDTRGALLKQMGVMTPTLTAGSDIIGVIAHVQDEFFEFAKAFGTAPEVDQRLFWTTTVSVGAHEIRFNCFNSAWTSVKQEEPGHLHFPAHLAAGIANGNDHADFVVSLIHHPTHWLTPASGSAIRDLLYATSHVVLTGHEHVRGRYAQSDDAHRAFTQFEGGVLHDAGRPEISNFQALRVSLPEWTCQRTQFVLRDGMYAQERQTTELVARNASLERRAFRVNDTFSAFLSDVGTHFTHPRRATLNLDDLFVYPDLRRTAEADDVVSKRGAERLGSQALSDALSSKTLVVVAGSPSAGKTSLAKMFFRDSLKRGNVPMVLRGDELNTVEPDSVWSLCVESVGRQYAPDDRERYRQLARDKRIVLIDDLHQSQLNAAGLSKLLDILAEHAATVVCFVDDLFLLNATAAGPRAAPFLSAAETYVLQELGFLLRSRVTRRWYELGAEYDVPAEDIDAAVVRAERTIDTLLGKNLLPATPVVVLSLLQIMEAGATQGPTGGSYGYLYEALITAALAKISSRISDVDTRYTYITHLAYAVFEAGTSSVPYVTLEKASERYFEQVRVKFSVEHEINELLRLRILAERGEEFSFRYRYIFCYFVARYLRDHAQDADARQRLLWLADRLHVDTHASIVTFYLYLTRDESLIRHILEGSRRIYGEYEPVSFEEDVEFINRLLKGLEPIRLPDGDVHRQRDEHRRALDDGDDSTFEHPDQRPDRVYDVDLEDLLKVNFAFKTLGLLGQVLRNFPGSLPGDLKLEITSECYALGLRTLRAFLAISQRNLDEIRCYLKGLIKEKRPFLSDSESAKEADEVLIWTTRLSGFGVVKQIASAVGMQQLAQTYAEVLEQWGGNVPASLVDLAIKLDHFRAVPVREIETMFAANRKNFYVQGVIRDLVADFLYLHRLQDPKVRQKLGAIVSIQSTAPKMLDNPHKKP